jgi:hypothetical protein
MAENGEKRLARLFAAARSAPPDTSLAEEGFEERVAARIRGRRPGTGDWAMGRWAWRLSPALAAVVLAVGVWTAATVPDLPSGPGTDVAASWIADDMADFLGGDG